MYLTKSSKSPASIAKSNKQLIYPNNKDKVIMEMMYIVERIEELDFGCEGRPEGMKDMVRVILKGDNGEEESMKVEDDWLYAHGIDEGDRVELDAEHKPVKAVSEVI